MAGREALGTRFSSGYRDTLTDLAFDSVTAAAAGALVALGLPVRRSRPDDVPTAENRSASPPFADRTVSVTQSLTAATVVCTASQERKGMSPRLCAPPTRRNAGSGADRRRRRPECRAEDRAGRLAAVQGDPSETHRQGNSEARNVGIHAATEDVVCFVDDDATVEPDWLASLMERFEASGGNP